MSSYFHDVSVSKREVVSFLFQIDEDLVRAYRPYAAWGDVPHLAGASEHACRSLVTYNLSDYDTSKLDIEAAEPGTAVRLVRTTLADL